MGMTNRGIPIGPRRFVIAVHALVWLARSEKLLPSSAIACQVNSHATFLRRVLQVLTQSGMVEAREGRDGGYALGKSASEITLADVYVALKAECAELEDNDNCSEADKQLDSMLVTILFDAEQQTIEYLRQFTIADMMTRIPLCDNS
ncbi:MULTISPECIES: RrF2 family transcriptional regulator [unclassified Paenibacillus]|uniref:RrF2 family transcriptional regulator n=1 Tax=unclassified Paenibacillus TaxID=185978 RepID=UPI003630C419